MKGGDTFIPAKFDHHLWLILSDPEINADKVVIVNLTTHTLDEEPHCILQKGDHPFIKHKTAIRYRDSKCVALPQLEDLVASGGLRKHNPLSAAILKKIRDGASLSKYLPEGCRQILEEQGII
jgi:hypothetical protein